MGATCPVCETALTPKQTQRGITHCGRRCAIIARGSAFRGVTCGYAECGNPLSSRGLCDKHYQRLKKYGVVTPDRLTENERFAAKFEVGDPNECWPWAGELANSYGVFRSRVEGRRVRYYAHRYALASQGVDIDGLVVRHSCDNPPCVNPNHLLPGTQADNIRDALERKRLNTSGLRNEYERPCRHCGTPFLGIPSSRYCGSDCAAEYDRSKLLRTKTSRNTAA